MMMIIPLILAVACVIVLTGPLPTLIVVPGFNDGNIDNGNYNNVGTRLLFEGLLQVLNPSLILSLNLDDD
jgi:hypothetical protein